MKGGVYGLVVKPESAIAERVALRVIRTLERLGVEVLVDEDAARSYQSLSRYPSFNVSRQVLPRLIVVGGDGTLLRTLMRLPDSSKTIIMTVRAGKKGFLLDVESYEVEERVEDFVANRFKLVKYPRLRVTHPSGAGGCVLNDAAFVMDKAKLVRLSVYHRGERIMGIDGDGLIVATTVGSTAYSLSAGGPIVDPGLNVIVLTPLNPVQLYLRPIVMPLTAKLEVEVRADSNPLHLVLDGQSSLWLEPGTVVHVEECGVPAMIARFKWWENYYERLYTRIFSYL